MGLYTASMFRPLLLLVSLSCIPSIAIYAQQKPLEKSQAPDTQDQAWKTDLAKRHQELVDRNGPGTNEGLRAQLLAMRDADQAARGVAHDQPKDKLRMASNMDEIDSQLTAGLKAIVAKSGWPTIATVGIDASNAAMLVLTHTRDHAWQLSLLPLLESLADQGRIDGAPLAMVVDKELVSEGKLQRYGTQFKYTGDGMAMYGVEDPGGLDAERAKAGLMSMEVYKGQLEQIYHMKVTGKIVMATPQASSAPNAVAK